MGGGVDGSDGDMAPLAGDDDWLARKENEAGNRQRGERRSAEDAPVAGTHASFEELLARELAKDEPVDGNNAGVRYGRISPTSKAKAPPNVVDRIANKRPFLKKGARGWWMEQPNAQAKMQHHTLTSKDEEDLKPPVRGRRSVKNTTAVARQNERLAPPYAQTVSSPVSPIHKVGDDDIEPSDLDYAGWKDTSFVSNATSDMMGLAHVRQSFEAKMEREADELAEFEAIERELAAEKDGYLNEKRRSGARDDELHRNRLPGDAQTSWNNPAHYLPASPAGVDGPSYGGIDHEPHLYTEHHYPLDFDQRSDLIYGNDRATDFEQRQEWRHSVGEESMDFQHRSSDPFPGGNAAPSELSAISFDDSVPWDEGLSFQPQDGASASSRLHSVQPFHSSTRLMNRQGDNGREYGSFDLSSDHETGGLVNGDDVPSDEDQPAPVSSLVQQVFGTGGGLNTSSSYSKDVLDDDHDLHRLDEMVSDINSRQANGGERGSLSMLKRKMNSKQKSSIERPRVLNRHGTGNKGTRAKESAPPRQPASKSKPRTTAGAPKATVNARAFNSSQATVGNKGGSGPILPVVIEEKLYELEEEVKFYKAETLQLQKRKEHYEQEVKKLAAEREAFAQFQQQQRQLIEQEWARERAKMKKEQQMMDRQWKLRMSATASTQGRKARGEMEVLKAQIVKMQLDENARAAKWKSNSESLRKRIAELEVKNGELRDEVKFLENERLVQWDKFETQLKEKQDKIDRFNDMKQGVDPIRTTSDLSSIRNTANELLASWGTSQDPSSGSGGGEPPLKQPQTDERSRAQSVASVAPSTHRRVLSSSDGYNPKRYSMEKAASDPSTSVHSLHGVDGERNFLDAGSAKPAFSPDPAPSANELDFAQQRSKASDLSEAHVPTRASETTGSSSSASPRAVDREVLHAGGKREVVYTDGSRRVVFPDGNEKRIDADGHTLIQFTNGDRKEVFPDSGVSIYYYCEAQTKLTTYPDATKVYEFPNGQIEKTRPDGTTEISYPDGITKTIQANGDEFSVFLDGTTMLERRDGVREVALRNRQRIRYYPDGRMACISLDGVETEVRSDAELRRLMER